MQTADIRIYGLIGNIPGKLNGVTLVDIIAQVSHLKEENPDLQAINVLINSEGGVVQDGNQIYDYLNELKSEYQINTKSQGAVSSIASKIFLLGTERIMRSKDRMLIHNPWSSPIGNASALESAADELRSIEKDMIKFYSSATGLNESAVSSIMANETILDGNKAKELGFATQVIESQIAFAYHKNIESQISEPLPENKNEFTKDNFLSKILNMKNLNLKGAIAFLQAISKDENKIVNLDLSAADGTAMRSTAESIDAIVGSTMSIVTEDGETPLAAGVYELSDGASIVVDENSIVTEFTAAPAPEEPTELELMQKKNDELTAELEKVNGEKASMKEKMKALNSDEFKENVMLVEKGILENEADKAELKRMKTAFALPMNQRFEKGSKPAEKNIADEAKERKAEYKKRGISMN
jgi:ATP-dependent Clp protease protease subunit